ncbi:MAG: dTMP kinase, partial [Rickettsiales bacterium]|nr:dTMP kinase [Rickettsiales bacterium]
MVEKLRGKFITFEGCEGVGKTTQSKLLVEYLGKNHVDAIWTREPGGCITAEKIRGLLLTGNTDKFDGITEMALMYAARLEHTEKKIKPYLKDGFVVVSDRYFDSTMAYQGYGQGVALERIEKFRECL